MDLPLTKRGIAALEGKKDMFYYPLPENTPVYTSGKLRTEQTLTVLFGKIAHEVEPDLGEMDFGKFEFRAYEELKDDTAYQRWITGNNFENQCPGGESGRMMTERVTRAFEKLLEEKKTENLLLVTHGGPIAALMERYFPEDEKNRYEWQPGNGEGYEIFFEGSHALIYHKIPIKVRQEFHFARVGLEEYVQHYVDPSRVPVYGEVYPYCRDECLPYDFDVEKLWRAYREIRLFAMRIFMPVTLQGVTVTDTQTREVFREQLSPGKAMMESLLKALEKRYPGSRGIGAGRYSLESLGGNISKTAEELLGFRILWIEDKKIPEYLTIMGGLLVP